MSLRVHPRNPLKVVCVKNRPQPDGFFNYAIDKSSLKIYSLTMKTFRYNLVLRPEPEGGFTVTVPALPGCVTYGKNLSQAKIMAEDAIAGYIQSLSKHGKVIPNDDNSFITVAQVGLMKSKIKKAVYA